jgi:hypothetical protein
MNMRRLVTGLLLAASWSIVAYAQQEVSVLRFALDASSGAQTFTDSKYPGLKWQQVEMKLESKQVRSFVPVARAVTKPQIYMRVFTGGVKYLLERSANVRPGQCIVFSGARYPIDLVGIMGYEIPLSSFLEDYISGRLGDFVFTYGQMPDGQILTIVFEEQPPGAADETSVLKLEKKDLTAYFSNAIELKLNFGPQFRGDSLNAMNPPPPPPQLNLGQALGSIVKGIGTVLGLVFGGQPAQAAERKAPIVPQPPKPMPTSFTVPGPCDRLKPSGSLTVVPLYTMADADVVPSGIFIAQQTCGE